MGQDPTTFPPTSCVRSARRCKRRAPPRPRPRPRRRRRRRHGFTRTIIRVRTPSRPPSCVRLPCAIGFFRSSDAQLESRDDWVCGPARDGRRGRKEVLLATRSATAHLFFPTNSCGRPHLLTSLEHLFTTPPEGPRIPFYLSKCCEVPSKSEDGFCLLRLTFPSASSPGVPMPRTSRWARMPPTRRTRPPRSPLGRTPSPRRPWSRPGGVGRPPQGLRVGHLRSRLQRRVRGCVRSRDRMPDTSPMRA